MYKKLNVSYFTQLDNLLEPYGTCNMTSLAMCMAYFGIHGDESMPQLEYQLTKKCFNDGLDRHDPATLVKLCTWKKLKDNFSFNTSWESIRKSIEKGNPVIIHGYFTRSGHIVVIKGYNDGSYAGKGAWIVNDPYGEYTLGGYVHGPGRGDGVLYSYELMKRLCSPDGSLWAHIIYKEG